MRQKLAIVLLTTSIFSLSSLSMAQERKFKAFRFDGMAGFGFSPNANKNPGTAISAEPKYSFTDQISLGLRLEVGVIFPVEGISVIPCMEYSKPFENGVRPFIGIGLGPMLKLGNVDENSSFPGIGMCVRAGLEYSHFRVSVENNASSNNLLYQTLKIGFVLGGGRIQ